MQTTPSQCPECQSPWKDGRTCQDDFHQMLYWEMEDLALFGGVHHLMVLCYHLQHPSLYSPEGLSEGIKLLVGFVEEGKTPAKVRSQIKDRVSSRERKFPITARPGRHGSYRFPVSWSVTASNVVAAGQDRYVESVRQWAKSVLDDLRESRNLD